jgi:hypothetical protein
MPGDPNAGGPPGGPQADYGMGVNVGANEPSDFRYPVTAVRSFLNAVKAKDPERLAQTIALHAPYEADEKRKKTFEALLNKSLPDNELSDLAKGLDGYQVADTNTPKTTGRLGVILRKIQGRDMLQRTITVRKEQAGWKVVDIGPVGTIQQFRGFPTKGMPGRRR